MFYKLINNIKIALIYKKTLIRLKLNKNEINLIRILIKLNLIKFIKKNNDKFDIIINHTNNFKNVKNLYRPGQKISISKNELQKITVKKKLILVLSTNKGLLTNFEALKKNTSGFLIMKISN